MLPIINYSWPASLEIIPTTPTTCSVGSWLTANIRVSFLFFLFSHFCAQLLNKRIHAHHRLLTAVAIADRHLFAFGFFVADYEHVGNLFHLGVADLLAERLGQLVYLDANAGGS